MTRSSFLFLVMVTVIFFFGSVSSADVPQMINYQGKLTTSGGGLVNDTVQILFSMYPDSLGSPSVWTETHADVAVKDGILSILLGSINPIGASIFDGNVKYLGIKVESDPEMRPLTPMVSVPYAYRAGNSEGGACHWSVTDSVLYTNEVWGIARGGCGNVLYGDSVHTMVNLGMACTTGTSSQNYPYCTVGGGLGNRASAYSSTVAGGWLNKATGGGAIVGGGLANSASGEVAAIGGGYFNNASGYYTFIGGGINNSATSNYATVGGGYYNAAGDTSTVGGGKRNSATGYSATIAGGVSNIVISKYSTIGGGYDDSIAGDYSVIPGGRGSTLGPSADYSMAFGRSVYVDTSYCVVFFDTLYDGHLLINRDSRNHFSDYPIRVGTNTDNGNGAYLTQGGVWTNGSSRWTKEDFQNLDGAKVLDDIENLSVTRWKFKGTEEHHISPVAQDFYQVFDCGVGTPLDDSSFLATIDLAGVSLIAIQELTRIVKEQQRAIEGQQKEIQLLKGKIEVLETGRR